LFDDSQFSAATVRPSAGATVVVAVVVSLTAARARSRELSRTTTRAARLLGS
jgi:hypothetical protein